MFLSLVALVGAAPSRGSPHELHPQAMHAMAQATRPNLIVALVDDVGYNDVGWRNSDVKTPFINGLMNNNSEPTVELMRHYTFSVCSPTRASLLTGRLPAHVSQDNWGVEFPGGMWEPFTSGIDLRMRTLPQLLGEAGYSTAHVGKWHLGSTQMAQLPSRRGFDESFAFLGGYMSSHLTHLVNPPTACHDSASMPAIDLWDNESPVYDHGGVHSCELFANRAVDIIERHDTAKPLFLYVALAEGHAPYDEVPRHSAAAISCSSRVPGISKHCEEVRHYRGMIACADEATRNITWALKQQGMWKDTLMLWSSDNGAARGEDYRGHKSQMIGSNAPYRGHKSQMLEGGVRVVAFLAGGFLPPTAPPTFQGMVHIADWFSTFAALAGINDPSDPDAVQHGLPDIDSINVWPFLTGGNQSSGRTELLLGSAEFDILDRFPNASLQKPVCQDSALIQGYWKIISRATVDHEEGVSEEVDDHEESDRSGEFDDEESLCHEGGKCHKGSSNSSSHEGKGRNFSRDEKRRVGSESCSSVEGFALFNLEDDPYEESPYFYDADDKTSDLAIKLGEMVGRLTELTAGKFQTGVTDTYLDPNEEKGGPLGAACSVAQGQPNGWFLEKVHYDRGGSNSPGHCSGHCSAGRHSATEEECLAAAHEAASKEGLEVGNYRVVDDGEESYVPAGCSYSSHSKFALYNSNEKGGTIMHSAGDYRMICHEDEGLHPHVHGATEEGDGVHDGLHPHAGFASRAAALAE